MMVPRALFRYSLLLAAGPAMAALAGAGLIVAAALMRAGKWEAWPVAAVVLALVVAIVAALRRLYTRTARGLTSHAEQIDGPSALDSLTAVYGRRFAQRRIEEAAAAAIRYGQPVSLLLIDVDQLRRVNAEKGSQAGDTVLAALGASLRDAVRATDVVGRWDGDEFVVVAQQTPATSALTLAERIRRDVPLRLAQPDGAALSVSIGLADLPGCADDATSLVRAAEAALALAQRRGPAGLVYFKDLHAVSVGPEDASIVSERLKHVTLGTIRALATAVDKRDHYTHGHGQALGQLLTTAAQCLGLDAQTTSILLAGAELHDVGKIGVPDHILRKPGPLTADEYAVMKRHPETGKDIVAAALELEELVPAILCHHERWDGQGYPRGLRGTEIPLVARLIAIADAYHAMISDRPYRKALTRAAAIGELRKNAGTQFDPGLVKVFLQALETQDVDGHQLEAAA